MKKKIYIVLLTCLITIGANAQFGGGNGDGFTLSTTNAQTLSGIGAGTLFAGGDGDGFDLSGSNHLTLSGISAGTLFGGGDADGFDLSAANHLTLNGIGAGTLFGGGDGDGFDQSGDNQLTLAGIGAGSLYAGGDGDGFDQSARFGQPLGVFGFNKNRAGPVVLSTEEFEEDNETSPSMDESESTLQVYPNPAGEHITLQWSLLGNEPVSIDLIDLNGRLIQSHLSQNGGGAIELDLGDIPPGMYLIRIRAGEEVLTKRVIHQ